MILTIEVKEYDEDLLILSFDDQINDHQTRTSVDHQTRTSVDHQTRTSVTSQKTRSRSLELKSKSIKSDSSSNTDISDALSKHLK